MAFAALAIGSLALGAYSAVEQKKASNIQQAELKVQAKTEAVSANQQSLQRRRDLIRALASQNAAAGAAGIQTDGSVAAIAKRDIRDARNDLLIDQMNNATRQGSLRSQGRNVSRLGTINAASTLLDSANTAYRAGA